MPIIGCCRSSADTLGSASVSCRRHERTLASYEVAGHARETFRPDRTAEVLKTPIQLADFRRPFRTEAYRPIPEHCVVWLLSRMPLRDKRFLKELRVLTDKMPQKRPENGKENSMETTVF